MITTKEADTRIRQFGGNPTFAICPLPEADGEVLGRAICADRDFPPFHRVAMDGIALNAATWAAGSRRFAIQQVQRAGEPRKSLSDPANCIEVMTGAILPGGCDTVVPYEELQRDGLWARPAQVTPGSHVHRQGSDCRAGTELIRPNIELRSPHCGVLAAVGVADVPVYQRPRIALVGTGDECVDVSATPEPHQIRRSNTAAFRAALVRQGFIAPEVLHVPDDSNQLLRGLTEVLERNDVIVFSGGVSQGKYDLIPQVLTDLGVRCEFHRVAQRPGKPMWFGVGTRGQLVFGLPGNPVAAVMTLHRYVLPALWRHLGIEKSTPYAAITTPIVFHHKLTLFLPVIATYAADARTYVTPCKINGSGDLTGLVGSTGFIELPPDSSTFAVGDTFPLYTW